MFCIEKISLPHIPGFSKAGLVDTFLSDNKNDFYLSFWNKDCNILGNTITAQLKQYNIFLGRKFGITGASIYQAILDNTNTVYEISDADISILPAPLLKQFLTNCTVLIHDYNEGGSFICGKNNLLVWLEKLNFVPKKIYLHTSNYNFKDTNLKNVVVLPHSDMFAIYTACSIPELVDDQIKRQARLDALDSIRSYNNFQYHAMVYNRKPRYHRVRLLAELDTLNILDQCFWTLAWNKEGDIIENDWIKSPNVLRHQTAIANKSVKTVNEFLDKYMDTLPKVLPNAPCKDLSGSRYIDLTWSEKVKWGTAVEVFNYTNSDYPNPQGFLSEKTWRHFLLGIPPLIISASGANTSLKKLGIQIVDAVDDTLEGDQRVQTIAKFLSDDFHSPIIDHSELKKMSLRNFELVTDKNFLASIVTNSLKDINLS